MNAETLEIYDSIAERLAEARVRNDRGELERALQIYDDAVSDFEQQQEAFPPALLQPLKQAIAKAREALYG